MYINNCAIYSCKKIFTFSRASSVCLSICRSVIFLNLIFPVYEYETFLCIRVSLSLIHTHTLTNKFTYQQHTYVRIHTKITHTHKHTHTRKHRKHKIKLEFLDHLTHITAFILLTIRTKQETEKIASTEIFTNMQL